MTADQYMTGAPNVLWWSTYFDDVTIWEACPGVCNGPLARYIKITCCTWAGNAKNVFSATVFKGNRGLTIPPCIMACATIVNSRCWGKRSQHSLCMRSLTYLARGPSYNWNLFLGHGLARGAGHVAGVRQSEIMALSLETAAIKHRDTCAKLDTARPTDWASDFAAPTGDKFSPGTRGLVVVRHPGETV